MARLLLIENNIKLAQRTAADLVQAGFGVEIVSSIAAASRVLAKGGYAVAILNLDLPDGDGLTVLRGMRRRGDTTPVIILLVRESVQDRVAGLSCGADDCVTQPVAMEELIARVRALMRRPNAYTSTPIRVGNVEYDPARKEVFVNGRSQTFSPRAIELLQFLMQMNGRVVPEKLVERHLFGSAAECQSNAVEVYVHRLRRQLENAKASVAIRTVRGRGYQLNSK